MIEFIKLQLLTVRAQLKQLNEALEKGGHRYTLEQAKMIYDKIKELEETEKELLLQLRAAETQALSEALNPPDSVTSKKDTLLN